jgi:hypothetical protein
MNGASSFFDPSENLEYESIATAMVSSNSLEELLKFFLTGLGDRLAVSRVAIYQLTNQYEGIVLLEAISPHILNIKNQIYPISYFGVDSLQNYPRDRAVKLSDTNQISKTFTAHPRWQKTEVKAIMSAPIVFNLSPTFDGIWGLAFVQQCDRTRPWQPQEAHFLFELSKVLSQCLQSWELKLQTSAVSHPVSQLAIPNTQIYDKENDREEFVAKRIDLSKDLEVLQSQPETITDDIALLNTFVLSDDEENEILDRSRIRNSEASINHAINLAMQRLDQETHYRSSPYPRVFERIDAPQKPYDIDLESVTLEDVLENCTRNKNENENKDQSKVIYLQQKVGDLIESMEQKLDEIALLQLQVQELTASQQELRQMLLDLQPENLQ